MSEHRSVLVPLEAWSYNSPDVFYEGKSVDIGLLAEAMLYYDEILLNVTNAPQLAELLQWFLEQDELSTLISLFQSGKLRIYDYAFMSTAILHEATGTYDIMNIQDPVMAEPRSFEKRFLSKKVAINSIPRGRIRRVLFSSILDTVIEVKADEFGGAVSNARDDFIDPEQSALLVQAFLDEVYPMLGWDHSPIVEATVTKSAGRHDVKVNVDIAGICTSLGDKLSFHKGTPLTAAVHRNRLLWSAATMKCDLYVGSPMSSLLDCKVLESGELNSSIQSRLERHSREVGFPDVRRLVNSGEMKLADVLHLVEKAEPLRHWLQDSDKSDADEFVAIHDEVGDSLNFAPESRKLLEFASNVASAVVAANIGGVNGAAIGTALSGFLPELARQLLAGCRLFVFGKRSQARRDSGD